MTVCIVSGTCSNHSKNNNLIYTADLSNRYLHHRCMALFISADFCDKREYDDGRISAVAVQ